MTQATNTNFEVVSITSRKVQLETDECNVGEAAKEITPSSSVYRLTVSE